jgi:hypothetical protein
VALRGAGNGLLTEVVRRGGEVCTAGLQGASTRRDVGEAREARAKADERTNNNSGDNDNV